MRTPGQAMVEAAFIMMLMLFTIAAGADLLWNLGNRAMVLSGIGHAASTASFGMQDNDVRQAAIDLSLGTIQPNDIQFTPCWNRQTEESRIDITVKWYPRPLTPMLERFWSGVWGQGFTHNIRTKAIKGCRWDIL